MNLANKLTISRIIMIPFILFFMLPFPFGKDTAFSGFILSAPGRIIALILFIFAALTDLFDGLLARKQGMTSNFGKLFDPIDSPISGASSDDRPMWNWIVANEKYTELYHQSFEEFLNSVDIMSSIDNAYSLIKSYVGKDPTAFYDYSEFEAGVETLRQFCALRTESIRAQIVNDKTSENMNYADASGLTLSKMGSMGRGGDMPEMPGIPSGFNPSEMPGGNTEQRPMPNFPGQQERNDPTEEVNPFEQDPPIENTTEGNTIRPSRNNSPIPGGDFNSGMDWMEPVKGNTSAWLWIAVSVLILCVGIVIVRKYK
jgi:hypothetical protein